MPALCMAERVPSEMDRAKQADNPRNYYYVSAMLSHFGAACTLFNIVNPTCWRFWPAGARNTDG